MMNLSYSIYDATTPHVVVDDPFAPPSLDGDEAEDDDSPFSRNAGLFSTGGGLFDDNEEEVTLDSYLSYHINPFIK